MSIENLYELRDYMPTDKAFIKATFLRGLYYGDSWFSIIPKQVFMDNYSPLIDSMLDNSSYLVKVACLKEDQDVILGYSMLSSDFMAIVWVFVKKAWREQGIARSLVPQAPNYVTHLTVIGKTLMSKLPNVQFNPFYRAR
jgi:hypothetical protein